jgi:hypothetical protein
MKMSQLLLAFAWTAYAASAMGEPVNDGVDAELDLQRQRIEAVRKENMAELAAQDAACLSRFAVTDCQNKVGVQRRAMLAELKRQEARLDERDRRQKGAAQLQRTQDKASERVQRQSEAQANVKADSPEQRQRSLDEKVLSHKNQARPTPPSAPVSKTASGLDAVTIESNRAAFTEKQQAAERRRADREKRLLDKASGSAPLPKNP